MLERIFSAIGRWLTPAADLETVREMRERQYEDHRQIQETVRRFIEAYPELEPAKWGIDPNRYKPSSFFSAALALDMLMGRTAYRSENEYKEFILTAAGTLTGCGALMLPKTVFGEITCFLAEDRRIPMLEHEATAARMVPWLVRALQLKPKLLRDYLAKPGPKGDATSVTLIPVYDTGGGKDPLDGWRV